MNNPAAVAVLSLAFIAGTAGAQAIYRCGNAYGDEQCPGASTVAPLRAPSAEQAAASRRETEREMKLASSMEAARLKQEAKPVAAYIPRDNAQKIEEKRPEVFTATRPKDPKKVAQAKPKPKKGSAKQPKGAPKA
jgi:hypothetical protein